MTDRDKLREALVKHKEVGDEAIRSGVMPEYSMGVKAFGDLCWRYADTILAALSTDPEQAVMAEREADGWERGMRDAANICATLSETTYDDADAFEAAAGCEAVITAHLRSHQRARAQGEPK